MRIALVDDERTEACWLAECISHRLGKDNVTNIFSSGEEFMSCWQAGSYDLIVLDIFMDRLNGLDTARKIREADRDVRLVFCTSSNEFASESYEVDAKYYLRKPFSQESVNTMIERLDLDSLHLSRWVALPDGRRVILRNVLYTEYSGHKVFFRCKEGGDITVRCTQAFAEELLCVFPYFFCCYKGIIVNFYEVSEIRTDSFIMSNDALIPISRRKFGQVTEAYGDFQFRRLRGEDTVW